MKRNRRNTSTMRTDGCRNVKIPPNTSRNGKRKIGVNRMSIKRRTRVGNKNAMMRISGHRQNGNR